MPTNNRFFADSRTMIDMLRMVLSDLVRLEEESFDRGFRAGLEAANTDPSRFKAFRALTQERMDEMADAGNVYPSGVLPGEDGWDAEVQKDMDRMKKVSGVRGIDYAHE